MNEIVTLLEKFIERKINTKIQNIACVLGTIQENGVKLDNINYVIEKPFYLTWNVKITLSPSQIKGQIGTGLTAGPYVVQGVLNFPASKVEIKDLLVETKPHYKEGDRVLCVLINNGNEVIVIGKVSK